MTEHARGERTIRTPSASSPAPGSGFSGAAGKTERATTTCVTSPRPRRGSRPEVDTGSLTRSAGALHRRRGAFLGPGGVGTAAVNARGFPAPLAGLDPADGDPMG